MNLSYLAQNHSSVTRLKRIVYRCQMYGTPQHQHLDLDKIRYFVGIRFLEDYCKKLEAIFGGLYDLSVSIEAKSRETILMIQSLCISGQNGKKLNVYNIAFSGLDFHT